MRSLRVVGIVMAVAGLGAVILGILRIGSFATEIGSNSSCVFTCTDGIGDLPLLFGGGGILMVVGLIIASAGSAAGRVARGPNLPIQPTLPSAMFQPTTSAGWEATALAGQAIAAEVGPAVQKMMQALQASGLMGGTYAATQLLDPVTGQPAASIAQAGVSTEAVHQRDLRATGTLATAVVESFRELPMPSPQGQLYELHLDVRPDGRPSYRVRHYELVPARWAYRVTNGASFPAWVDPADPSRLLIEWERS